MEDEVISNQDNQWQVESLRLTFFCEAEYSDLWRKITDAEPDELTHNRQQGTKVEKGLWNDMELTVAKAPDRINILLSSVDKPPNLPSIGSLEQALSYVPTIMSKLSGIYSSRIAIGLVYLFPVDDKNSCYNKISEILPDVPISKDMKDFVYQYNIPKDSDLYPSLYINRLITYSAARLVFMRFNVSTKKHPDQITKFALRIEVDVNTDADFVLDDSHELGELMSELVSTTVDLIPSDKE